MRVSLITAFLTTLMSASMAQADLLQLNIDKTLLIRSSGGLTITHAYYFSSKSSNLTGSIDYSCRLNFIGKAHGEAIMALYHGDYKTMDETVTNYKDVQYLRLRFKQFEDCKKFMQAIDNAHDSDENRFQLVIDTNRVSLVQNKVTSQWPLVDVISKVKKPH